MRRKFAIYIIYCVAAMIGLLILQAFWISKYYRITYNDFRQQATSSFESAVRKEFAQRSDSIEIVIAQKLADTSSFILSMKPDTVLNKLTYTITSRTDSGDHFSATLNKFPAEALMGDQGMLRHQLASIIAHNLRNDDLENHVIYYRTQELGRFILKATTAQQFDTMRLRPVLDNILREQNIHVPYVFLTASKAADILPVHAELRRKFPVTTRSLPTYRSSPGQQYICASFEDPKLYILSAMWLILLSSGILVCAIGCCLYILLKRLHQEKKLLLIKNDFISNITHEFKTPISTALLAVEALADPAILDNKPKVTRYVQHAKKELQQISSLTNKILHISLYENSNSLLKKERIKVADQIREIIDIKALTGKKVSFQLSSDTDVIYLTADKAQFAHALSNVIDNSVKYGGGEVCIRINCAIENRYFVTSIRDNGPGIAAGDIPFVFDKFFRSNKGNQSTVEGFGLGLYYVKQIMELHGGWCKIEINQGTTIKLGWPL
ncbi:MAG: hypothetical protein DI535_01375 [Citrobacter freundii]|nr:MAG: hypothetical protein DI535_01375 [Citrobacter freundii]